MNLKYFRSSSLSKSIWQCINSFIPYFICLFLAIFIHSWISIPFVILASGFMVRIFIIFHDCGHQNFLKSNMVNDIIGFLSGIIVFTNFHLWRWEHNTHHWTSSNLDKRGIGDVWTMTLNEYKVSKWYKKFVYRIIRHPVFLFLIAPPFVFIILHRFVGNGVSHKIRWQSYANNLAIFVYNFLFIMLVGLKTYLLIQIPIIWMASGVGIWMFYVQHNFPHVYWAKNLFWNFERSGTHGSSFYKLPKILQWFTGNIGFHHIHHLDPKIPNYRLEEANKQSGLELLVKPMSLKDSLQCLNLRVFDETTGKLIPL